MVMPRLDQEAKNSKGRLCPVISEQQILERRAEIALGFILKSTRYFVKQ